eukprot:m.113889 g.113889  ORF g.113889 m.113889 type:complete len:2831 (+) comp37468_c0_seq2:47-8539(+)
MSSLHLPLATMNDLSDQTTPGEIEFNFLFQQAEAKKIRAVDVLDYLKSGRIILSGGRDRRGGAVITFPGSADTIPTFDEVDRVLKYLASIPSENVRDLGFTVIADMRNKDSGAMKMLLKVLQRCFSAQIHMVYVLKPDRFWQNRRATFINTGKYAYEVTMLSQPGDLKKHFHPKQLTSDLQGELHHDQESWIMMQTLMESLMNDVLELGSRFLKWDSTLARGSVSLSSADAEAQLSEHMAIQKFLGPANVQALSRRLRELVTELEQQTKVRGQVNPDFETDKVRLETLIDKLELKRKKMEDTWHSKGIALKQCTQWKQVEEKVKELIAWYEEKVDFCGKQMGHVGRSLEEAKRILSEQEEIKTRSAANDALIQNVRESGDILIRDRNRAEKEIKTELAKLDEEALKLDELTARRDSLLVQSVRFYSNCREFYGRLADWEAQSDSSSLADESDGVEKQIYGCRSLREKVVVALADAKREAGDLRSSLADCVSGSQSSRHIEEMVEKMVVESETLGKKWQGRMKELSQGLALRLFKNEAEKVYSWMDEIGLPFLKKSAGVGQDYQSAFEMLEKHKAIEASAQIMHSTSDKLLGSSEELAVHGQVKVDEIRQVADRLEERVHDILSRFERRREQLELSVAFYRTANELTKWMDSVEDDVWGSGFPDSLNEVRGLVNECQLRRNNSAVQTANTLAQGQTLIRRLSEPVKRSGGVEAQPEYFENRRKINNVMEQLQERHAGLDSMLADRKMKLELCLLMRTFEVAAAEHRRELDQFEKGCQSDELAGDVDTAVKMVQIHNGFTESIEEAYTYVTETGHNLLERLGETTIQLTASQASAEPAASYIRRLLTGLAEKFTDAQVAGQKRSELLEECYQFKEFEANVRQAFGGINGSYQGLVGKRRIVGKTRESADCLLKEHEEFEMSIDTMQASVQELEVQAEAFLSTNHYAKETISNLVESLVEQWKFFAQAADNRHALLTTAHDIHGHHEHLSGHAVALQYEFGSQNLPENPSEAESLVDEHKRQKEYFAQDCARFNSDTQFLLQQLKDLVLPEYCTDTGLIVDAKYLGNVERVEVMLDGMKAWERKVVRLWAKRNSMLEQHIKMLDFVKNAKKVCDWLYNANQWLLDHKSLGDSLDSVEELLKASEEYEKGEVETNHQMTLRLMEKASDLEHVDHCDASRLKVRVQVLNDSWEDFDKRIKAHRSKLKISKKYFQNLEEILSKRQEAMGFLMEMDNRAERCDSSAAVQSLSDETVAKHEETMSAIESFLSQLLGFSEKLRDEQLSTRADLTSAQCNGLAREFVVREDKLKTLKGKHEQIEKEKDERKRLERRRDLLMQEMADTEESYVNDLDYVLVNYVAEMQKDGPIALAGQELAVLGNLHEILMFHKETFFVALKAARNSTEEMAQCFTVWKDKILSLYLTYCRNQPRSAALLAEKAPDFLTEWQLSRGHAMALGAYLIKPVQRITRYHLLLHELKKYVQRLDEPMEKLEMAFTLMLDIPKKSNDVMSLALLKDFDGNLDDLGELHHQGAYTVLDTRAFRSKEKDRQVFFFEKAVVVSKIERDTFGNSKEFLFRNTIKTTEMMLSEFIENQPCKFSLSTGRSLSEKFIFKATSIDEKQATVQRIRTILQYVQPVPDFSRGVTLRRSLKKRRAVSGSITPTTESKTFLASALSSMISSTKIELRKTPSDSSLGKKTASPLIAKTMSLPLGNSKSQQNATKKGKKKRKESAVTGFMASSLANLMASSLVGISKSPPKTLMPVEGTEASILLTPEVERKSMSPPQESEEVSSIKTPSPEEDPFEFERKDSIAVAEFATAVPAGPKTAVVKSQPEENESKSVFSRRVGASRRLGLSRRSGTVHKSSAKANLVELTPRDWSPVIDPEDAKLPEISVVEEEAEEEQGVFTVKGIFIVCEDYAATGEDDLSVSKGQKMEIFDMEEKEWWYGRTANCDKSKTGWIPAAYLDLDDTVQQPGVVSLSKEHSYTSQVRTPPLTRPPQHRWKKRNFALKKNSESAKDLPGRLSREPHFSRDRFRSAPQRASEEARRKYSMESHREYVLRELLDTERNYVRDLATAIHTYGKELRSPNLPDSLKGKYNVVFGNMEQIYSFHWNTLLPALERCDGVVDVALCFSAQKEPFQHIYVAYCENKPKSEAFVASFQGTFFEDVQQQLGHRQSLAGYLIKPVQRIMKYQLLFKDLQKYSRRLGCPEEDVDKVQCAWQIMIDVPKRANDIIHLGMIEGFEGNIHALGDLLLRDDFLVTDIQEGKKRIPKKRHVFLLEQVLILTKERQDLGLNAGYSTRDSMKMKSVGMLEVAQDGDPLKFEIWVGKTANPSQKYEIQASCADVKKQWVDAISNILKEQMKMFEALRNFSVHHESVSPAPSDDSESKRLNFQRVQSLIGSEDSLVDEDDQWNDLPPVKEKEKPKELYVAGESYSPADSDVSENIIGFEKGQVLEVLEKRNTGWWMAKTISSPVVQGWVPSDYLDLKVEESPEEEKPLSSTLQRSDAGSSLLAPSPSMQRKGSFRRRERPIMSEEELSDLYDIKEELGKGRFSVVKRCIEKKTGTGYAAKIFKKRPSVEEMVKSEITILNHLKHSRVIGFYKAFKTSRSYAVILELVDGDQLFEYVVKKDVLSEQKVAAHIKELLLGVEFIHQKNILHLDIKPENVMVSLDKEVPFVKLVDFGSACKMTKQTKVPDPSGPTEFFAPEVVQGRSVCSATDLWSVGAVLYTLVIGTSPFHGENMEETTAKVLRVECSYEGGAWDALSSLVKDFIKGLLVELESRRMTVQECLNHKWLEDSTHFRRMLDISRLKAFNARRRWQRQLAGSVALGNQSAFL